MFWAGIERVHHAKLRRRLGHQLHQAQGAFGRDGARVPGRFGLNHGADQRGVDRMPFGMTIGQGVQVGPIEGWGRDPGASCGWSRRPAPSTSRAGCRGRRGGQTPRVCRPCLSRRRHLPGQGLPPTPPQTRPRPGKGDGPRGYRNRVVAVTDDRDTLRYLYRQKGCQRRWPSDERDEGHGPARTHGSLRGLAARTIFSTRSGPRPAWRRSSRGPCRRPRRSRGDRPRRRRQWGPGP